MLKKKINSYVLVAIIFLGVFGTFQILQMNLTRSTALSDDEIVIGTTDSIMSLDPAHGYDILSSTIMMHFTHGLMEMPVDSTDAVKGPIVESYTVSSDAKEYTFVLKTGIFFSDGTPFNASAMIWNLNRALTLGGDSSFLLTDVVNRTEKVDENTIKIFLNTPDATFLNRLTYPIGWPISTISLSVDEIGGEPDSIPAGLGPYIVSSWTKDTEIILDRNPNYFGTAPKNKKIIIKFFSDSSTLLTALENNEVDVANRQFGPEEMTTIQNNPDLGFQLKETAGIRYLVINCLDHPDVRIRRAIAASVNRSEITATIFNNFNKELYSMVPEIFTSHIDAFEAGPTMSYVTGNMTAAGYSTSNKYPIELSYTPTHYGDTEKDVAELVEQQLEATGYFEVTLMSSEWGTFVEAFLAQTMPFYLLGWWFDYPDPSNYVAPFVGPTRYSAYDSSEMDGYVNTMITDPDAADRMTATINAQKGFAKDVPVVPLFTMVSQFIAYQKGITGVSLEPSENIHFNSIEKTGADGTPGFDIFYTCIGIFIIGSVLLSKRKKKRV
ncbi:ABC transporter substrate-binding protein [Candidatus Hodarchaeum mangrovi]